MSGILPEAAQAQKEADHEPEVDHQEGEEDNHNNEKARLLGGASGYQSFQRSSNNHKRSVGQSFDTCPTCKGLGKVDRDEKNSLVALIPLTDKRLNFVGRIRYWIVLTIVICVLLGAVISFLLAPRSIEIVNDVKNVKPYDFVRKVDARNKTIGLTLNFEENFDVKNNNFYSVQVRNLTLQLDRNSERILPKIGFTPNFNVPGLDNKTFSVKISYDIYSRDPYDKLCIDSIIDSIFASVVSSFGFSTFWTTDQTVNFSNIQYIGCSNETFFQSK